MKHCNYCNKKFTPLKNNIIYCSYQCTRDIRNFRKRKKTADKVFVIKLNCPECNKLFKKKSNSKKGYCSTKCQKRFNGKLFNKRRLKKIKEDKKYKEHYYGKVKIWRKNNKDKVNSYHLKTKSKLGWKEKRNEYLRQYYKDPKNYERRKELRSIRYWQKGDREKKMEYKKQNKDKIKQQAKEYYKKSKDKIYEYRRNKFKTDPIWILRSRIRTRFYTYIKRGLAKKKVKTLDLIGCDWDFLKQHLEKQFKPKMNWKNHGKWHIDHIIPMSHFNMFSEKQQKKCFHYSNLQPLWASENLSKGNKIIPPTTHDTKVSHRLCS